ncbi:glycosyltransferase family 31 protein [Rhizoctonia solani]|uniref:Glycosyltransferase family 31 protein n=1 Tax=Rhizoctonia solani TaxID=456999 RepID=A0A8H8NTX8_9AGAM|nr:glycosyltransferase family 31 protein [Rhizoctonia solani]QRW19280.1 glycosyltransferase family 31 protein [Rhizoctonia solani]
MVIAQIGYLRDTADSSSTWTLLGENVTTMRGLPFTILPPSRPSSRPSSPPPDAYDSSTSEYEVPNRRAIIVTVDNTTAVSLGNTGTKSADNSDVRLWLWLGVREHRRRHRRRRPLAPSPHSPGLVVFPPNPVQEETRPAIRRTWLEKMLDGSCPSSLFPTQISSILLALLLFALFALALTLLLMHILNPDKYQLPWRSYCSLAPAFPPKPSGSSLHVPTLDQLPPTGVFVGVMSMDSAFERRQLIRSTWASHPRSRGGASPEYGLNNTSRTVVRFILGQPRKDWERRIRLEQQAYNDLVILPIKENMNNGKTHAFFTWAHSNALVPPPVLLPSVPEHDNYTVPLHSSGLIPPWYRLYATENESHVRRGPAPAKPAPHDPAPVLQPESDTARRSASAFSSKFPRHLTSTPNLFPREAHDHGHSSRTASNEWIRPDFVIKADDDSFVMLAELEARLRWELYEAKRAADTGPGKDDSKRDDSSTTTTDPIHTSRSESAPETTAETSSTEAEPSSMPDIGKREFPEGIVFDKRDWSDGKGKDHIEGPLIYWGYLVKSRFMAGELYALSSSLVEYVATYPALKSMTNGAEDKQVAAWMKAHPQAANVRWRSERCWVYDHPKAGTVYSHGFLFPSEAARVRYQTTHGLTPAEIIHLPTSYLVDDPVMFGTRYSIPGGFTNFSIPMEVEALVEGSALSRLGTMPPPLLPSSSVQPTSFPSTSPNSQSQSDQESLLAALKDPQWSDVVNAYASRESRKSRYAGQSVGGTVVVHYIKRNEWFLEAALALLGDDDGTEDGPAL